MNSRNSRMRTFLAALILCQAIFGGMLPVTAEAAADPKIVATNGIDGWPAADDIPAETACLIDADTGTVLFDKSMDQQMYPASITKVMTTLIALKYGNLDDVVTITEESAAYVYEDSSNLYVSVGEQFRLEDLLYGVMLSSANDMATAVGIHIAGSIDAFCGMMNEEAERLGCTGTHFHNACGMPDPDHWTTAHDMALIGREALRYEKFREIVSAEEYAIPPTNLNGETRYFANHDPLLSEEAFYYDGIIGGKTGYTDAAGSTLTNYAERGGMTLVVVTMKSEGIGNAITANRGILSYGFANFHREEAKEVPYALSGGMLTIPNDKTAADCDVEENTVPDGEHGTLIVRSYRIGGQEVGTVTLTEEAAAENEKPETPDESDSDSSISSHSSDSPAQNGDESVNDRQTGDTDTTESGDAETRETHPLHRVLIILIVAALVALAAVQIILNIIRAKKRKESRRRRREQ